MSTVTRGPWSYDGMYGSDIVGYIIQPFRLRERHEFESRGLSFTGRFNFKIQRGQIYGLNIPLKDHNEKSTEIGLQYGYIQPYNRNLCNFVMSRRARKHGYISTDHSYLRKQEEYKKKFPPK